MPHRSPLAVVGAACRLPGGVDSFDRLTAHVLEGRSVLAPAPAWRGWDAVYDPTPGRAGRTCQIDGGWLEGLRDVDCAAFGLNPREATSLDPQQRLLLEVTRETLEHAGRTAADLAAERTGVWVGIGGSEFRALAQRREVEAIDAWIATGTQTGVAAGRLAYWLGTHGPAVSVDTACSSSLVALHHACRALWDGEVDAALVAGVHVLLDPQASVSMSAVGTLSPTGRCHTYEATADGYVRGEGCVAVLLVREPRPADRVLGRILATACNHDGRSNGLTAPSGAAQRALLRSALDEAGLEPSSVAYQEGHGSATRLGDAVELGALAEVHAGRATPLPVGSLKATMGHLEAASGLAGLLRALVAVREGRAPPRPSDDPPSEALVAPLVLGERALRGDVAAVSSFGIGGTNAHVLLRAPEPSERGEAPAPGRPLPLVLSASSAPALRAHLEAVTARLPGLPFADACGTAARGRAPLAHRLAVVASDAAEAVVALREATPRAVEDPPRVALLFPGQGPGTARGVGLADVHPAARGTFDRVAAVADPLLGGSLEAAMRAGPLTDVRWLQVGVFAVSMALAETLRALGLRPLAVAGHSSGEVAAACVAGVLDLEDAVRLLVARGEVLHRSGPGGMAAVVAGPEALELPAGPVGVAAENHPGETVISGPTDALAEVVQGLRRRGLVVRPVELDRAGHSALVEPHLDVLRAVTTSLTFHPASLEAVSAVTGDVVGSAWRDPEAWVRQMRVPVRFDRALATLAARGVDTFVELGPHPVLGAAVAAVLPGARAIRSLHRDEPEDRALARLVAELWSAGAELSPGGLLPPHRTVDLPLTPFDRRRLWPEGLDAVRPAPRYVTELEPVGADPGEVPDGRVVEVPEGLAPEAAALAVARALADAAGQASPPRVWVVLPDEPLAAAAVAGVTRCATLETPALGATLLPRSDPATLARLRRLPRGVTVVRAGPDGLGVLRWRSLPDVPHRPFTTRGTWLVTGGFGALGTHVSRWLEQRGATRVLRVGRRGGPGGLAADVSDPERLAWVLGQAGDDLVGVVHASGVVRDQPVHAIDAAALREVFAARAGAALHLEAALAERPDVHLVLFGSVAGELGGRGQGAYAAAMEVMRAVGARRRAAGGRVTHLAWGPWSGSGMAAATEAHRVALGVPAMAPASALAALDTTLASGDVDVAVVELGPDRPHHPMIDGPERRERRAPVDRDHVVDGAAVLAGADRVVAALELAGTGALADLRYQHLPATEAEVRALRLATRGDAVTLSVDGVVALVATRAEPDLPAGDLGAARAACPRAVDLDALWARFERDGLWLGPSRRLLEAAWTGDRGWVCELAEGGTDGARLDACLLPGAPTSWPSPRAIPAGMERIGLAAPLSTVRAAHGTWREVTTERAVSDVVLFDAAGRPVGEIRGHVLNRSSRGASLDPSAGAEALVAWVLGQAAELLGRDPAAHGLGADQELADAGFDSMMGVELRNRITAQGVSVPLHLVVGAGTPRQIAAAIAARAPPAPDRPPASEPAPRPADDPEEISPLASHLTAALVGAVAGAVVLALLEWLVSAGGG